MKMKKQTENNCCAAEYLLLATSQFYSIYTCLISACEYKTHMTWINKFKIVGISWNEKNC